MRKELSVFDVQEALRQHRDYGHDVLSNPRQTIFEGTPYQTRLGTRLIIRDDSTPFAANAISSLLMQSERPVISALSSSYHKNLKPPYRTVVSMGTPSVTIPHDSSYADDAEYGSNFHFWGPGSNAENHAPKLDFRDDSLSLERWPEALASTPHEALQNHVTSPFKTVGLHREPNGLDHFSYNLTHPKTLNDFKTPFNTQEALYKLINFSRGGRKSAEIIPFSNVIIVHQPGVNSIDEGRKYIYLPETEQLHKVSGP